MDLLTRGASVQRQLVHSGTDLLLQATYPLHDEFVDIGANDGYELKPLQKRRPFVNRLLQHAAVELKPCQLPVQIPLAVVQVEGAIGPVCALFRHLERFRLACLQFDRLQFNGLQLDRLQLDRLRLDELNLCCLWRRCLWPFALGYPGFGAGTAGCSIRRLHQLWHGSHRVGCTGGDHRADLLWVGAVGRAILRFSLCRLDIHGAIFLLLRLVFCHLKSPKAAGSRALSNRLQDPLVPANNEDIFLYHTPIVKCVSRVCFKDTARVGPRGLLKERGIGTVKTKPASPVASHSGERMPDVLEDDCFRDITGMIGDGLQILRD